MCIYIYIYKVANWIHAVRILLHPMAGLSFRPFSLPLFRSPSQRLNSDTEFPRLLPKCLRSSWRSSAAFLSSPTG